MDQNASDFAVYPVSKNEDMLLFLIEQRLIALTRYSWLPPQEAVNEHGLETAETFSLTNGPVLIEFDGGEIIGFASQPSLASVECWKERDRAGNWTSDRIDQDPELFPISAADPTYATPAINSLVGAILCEIAIWTRAPVDSRWVDLPRDLALHLVGDEGRDLWLTHGLHTNSDDFSVLERRQIRPDLLSLIYIKRILNMINI